MMDPTDPGIMDPSQPAAWAFFADEDWRAVEAIMAAPRPSFGVVCFLCQQTAEKYLKAFLVEHGVEPVRTHDLDRLRADCCSFDTSLQPLAADCSLLNVYSAPPRYPTTIRIAKAAEAQSAVAAAERIRAAIRQRLGL